MEQKVVIDVPGLREWLEKLPQYDLALLEITKDEYDAIERALIILRREARPYNVDLWAATERAFIQLKKSIGA